MEILLKWFYKRRNEKKILDFVDATLEYTVTW